MRAITLKSAGTAFTMGSERRTQATASTAATASATADRAGSPALASQSTVRDTVGSAAARPSTGGYAHTTVTSLGEAPTNEGSEVTFREDYSFGVTQYGEATETQGAARNCLPPGRSSNRNQQRFPAGDANGSRPATDHGNGSIQRRSQRLTYPALSGLLFTNGAHLAPSTSPSPSDLRTSDSHLHAPRPSNGPYHPAQ